MISFRQLEVLKTLLATGSTIATAKSMNLSQSGVSRLLQQLESDLSLMLFARDKGRLIPTPEALILAKDAENVLLGIERFSELADDLRTGVSGPDLVRVGLPSSMWENFAPAVLAEYGRNFPNVRIETFFETTTAITRMIEQRVIDFGFLRYEGEIPTSITMEPVARGVSVCVMHKDHPLAAKKEIGPKDLRGEPLIMLGRQRPQRVMLDNTFQRAGVRQNVRIETHSNSSACAYAAHNLGVGIVSSFYANLYPHLPIVQRQFVPVATQEFGLAKPTGVPPSLATQALMDTLKQQIDISQK
jgi:DNA-binding transcriptional LysR family regulator